jgi:ESCRT-I complex subunit VPS37
MNYPPPYPVSHQPADTQPDYPAALGSLQHMDVDSLKEILNNEDKFDEFIQNLQQIKSLHEQKEVIMASNKSLAEYNLSQEPVVKEQKAKLLEKFQSASSLAEKVKGLKAEIDNKSGKMTPDSLLILLEAACSEAEEESEEMVETFMSSQDNSLDEFLNMYKDKRKLAHMRRIKIDKMRELLVRNNQHSNNQRRSDQVMSPVRQAPLPPRPRI